MTREQFLQAVLDGDWTEADLFDALELGRAVEQSDDLRVLLKQLDIVRQLLQTGHSEADGPRGGWAAFEQRLVARVLY